ncbi:hypothetical protein AAHR73_004069 [Yersinia enterocolitica]|uniref:hypothetical protein n=1 Tax=Enterobacterales TaxID=91347 RepID=UPI0005DC64E1|nr:MULTISPECIES: hypothetical protein [Enterobacterales]NRF74074.1 hypothetical protein [Citrobacter braakii]CQH54886.1 Uncharacterised protein [Yersinia enterocolitica]
MNIPIKINKSWWEYLLPKQLIPRRREVESLINEFIHAGSFVGEWLQVAQNPEGIFRVKPGNLIPNLHLVFIGKKPGFIAPFGKIKEGHRTVGRTSQFASGKALENDELVTVPIISVEMVTDPLFITASAQSMTTINENKITQPSLLFSIPAHYLLFPQLSPSSAYVLYQHIFGYGASYPIDGYFYVGVTKRSWQKRWAEHKRAINNDSQLLFHRKFREELQNGRITYLHHKVMAITDDLEQLYKAEEFLVEGHWDDERRLNMIPGGKSGLRYMREKGMLKGPVVPLSDERDGIVNTWLKENPRKGLPAPWVAEKWKDNDWAIAQICGRDDRLSAEQVRAIRKLAETFSSEEICTRIGARDIKQVNRVINGKTYSRVDELS